MLNVTATGVTLVPDSGQRGAEEPEEGLCLYLGNWHSTGWGSAAVPRSEQDTGLLLSYGVYFSVSSHPSTHLATKQESQTVLFTSEGNRIGGQGEAGYFREGNHRKVSDSMLALTPELGTSHSYLEGKVCHSSPSSGVGLTGRGATWSI